MTYVKNISIAFGFILIGIFSFTLIATFFHYINWIHSKTLAIVEIIIPFLSLFLGGFYIGKKSKKKGWLEGLKLGGIFWILLILFQYLGLHMKFEPKIILFYLLLFISCILGSMIGINKNETAS